MCIYIYICIIERERERERDTYEFTVCMPVNGTVGMSRRACVVEVDGRKGARKARAKGNESRRHEERPATNSPLKILSAERGCA